MAGGGLRFESIRPEKSGQCPGLTYHISYDGGLTWSYWGTLYLADAGSPEHIGSVNIRPLDDDTAIAVYHRGISTEAARKQEGGYGPMVIGASWLRKVPADSAKAAELEYPEWLEEMALQNAIAEAEKIVAFPEEWYFRFDAEDRGPAEKSYRQESFEDWGRMRIDKRWTRQGEPRLGVGWYATSFQMPETRGIPLMLLFGAVDGVCDVFIDGGKVGSQTVSPALMWDRPFGIPLDKGLAPGRHALVIRVKKEYSDAGIHKPVWIVAKSDALLVASRASE